MVILLVRGPLSSLTEPNNVIRLLCSRVDRLSLSRAVTHCSRLGTLQYSELANCDIVCVRGN